MNGTVTAKQHYDEDGDLTDIEITQADQVVEFSAQLLNQIDPRFGRVTIRLGTINPVEYVVIGVSTYGMIAKRVK